MTNAEPTRCLLCEGALETGFILDHRAHSALVPEKWGAGEPAWSFWLGTKRPERTYTVRAYRCTACGFLMQYAAPDPNAAKTGER